MEQRVGVSRRAGRMSDWVGVAVGGTCRWEEWAGNTSRLSQASGQGYRMNG